MSGQHEEWLAYAEDDLRFAELGFKEGFYTQVCFHSQQTIEKSLKGTMVALKRIYPKSHNLLELAKKLPELSLEKYYEELTIIDGYYIPIRYPDATPGTKASGQPNKTEAGDALNTARKIWDIVSRFLSSQ